jgi:Glycosyl transferases group 1
MASAEGFSPTTPQCQAEMVFVGAGEFEGCLRRDVARSGVPVTSHGFQNPESSIYAAADLLVLPSDHHETWGIVVNEAMTCGISGCGIRRDGVWPGPDRSRRHRGGIAVRRYRSAGPGQSINPWPCNH